MDFGKPVSDAGNDPVMTLAAHDLWTVIFDYQGRFPMDKIEQTYLEMESGSMSEAELREAARQYAQELIKAESDGVSPVSEKEAAALLKLKKKDLLEIMLRQGEEIDLLRARVTDLEARLASKEISISKAGNLAEASLAVTAIFAEAQKAADIYLSNIRKAAGSRNEGLYIRGADSDE